MTKSLLAVSLLITSVASAVAGDDSQGAKIKPAAEPPACATQEILKQDYLVWAHNALNPDDQQPHPGGCTTIPGGTEVEIIHEGDAFVCVRPAGQSDCLWITRTSIERK